jgi:hypothetical protein
MQERVVNHLGEFAKGGGWHGMVLLRETIQGKAYVVAPDFIRSGVGTPVESTGLQKPEIGSAATYRA